MNLQDAENNLRVALEARGNFAAQVEKTPSAQTTVNAYDLKIKQIQDEIEIWKQEVLKQVQAPNKVIPNNEIIGPPLVPTNTGQAKQFPLLPVAAGVGIIVLAVALTRRKRKN